MNTIFSEISVTAREVKIRTQTSLRCVLTNLKYEVWIFWTNAELYLQSGYNGLFTFYRD